MDAQWHYKDEHSGKRLGPVGRDEIERLIAADRIERASLVWNPAMPDWAKASTTELVSLFGDRPPPMPASELNRWIIYLLALVPLWGTAIQAIASSYLSEPLHLSAMEVFASWAWIFFFIIANGLLGQLDEWGLEKAGLKIKGAAALSALITPVYIFVSCRRVARHAGRGGWPAYIPFVLWFAAFAGSLVGAGYMQEVLA